MDDTNNIESKIITTVTKTVQDDYVISNNDVICFDLSTNRLGIGTLNPLEALHISGGSIRVQDGANNVTISNGQISASNINLPGYNLITTLVSHGLSLEWIGPSLEQHATTIEHHGLSLEWIGPSLEQHATTIEHHGLSLEWIGPSLEQHATQLRLNISELSNHDLSLVQFELMQYHINLSFLAIDSSIIGFLGKLGNFDGSMGVFIDEIARFDASLGNFEASMGVFIDEIARFDASLGNFDASMGVFIDEIVRFDVSIVTISLTADEIFVNKSLILNGPPLNNNHAVTKGYVDGLSSISYDIFYVDYATIEGEDFSCIYHIPTAQGDAPLYDPSYVLTSGLSGDDTQYFIGLNAYQIDNLSDFGIEVGHKILVKNQSDPRTNGVYTLRATNYIPRAEHIDSYANYLDLSNTLEYSLQLSTDSASYNTHKSGYVTYGYQIYETNNWKYVCWGKEPQFLGTPLELDFSYIYIYPKTFISGEDYQYKALTPGFSLNDLNENNIGVNSLPIDDISLNIQWTWWWGLGHYTRPISTTITNVYIPNVTGDLSALWEVYKIVDVSHVLTLAEDYSNNSPVTPYVYVKNGTSANKGFTTDPSRITVLDTSVNFTSHNHIIQGLNSSITSSMIIPGSITGDHILDQTIGGSKLSISTNTTNTTRFASDLLYYNSNNKTLSTDPSNIYLLTPGNIILDAANSTQRIELDTSTNNMTLTVSGGNINLDANTVVVGSISAEDISVNNLTTNSLTVNSEKIAIGLDAGQTSQHQGAIALGSAAGLYIQEENSIAIGSGAGQYNLGKNSIAIGKEAGFGEENVSQSNNVIILNATDVSLNSHGAYRFYVAPVRDAPLETGNLLYYTPSSEVVQSNITFNNGQISASTIVTTSLSANDISVNNMTVNTRLTLSYEITENTDAVNREYVGSLFSISYNMYNVNYATILDQDFSCIYNIPSGDNSYTLTSGLISEINESSFVGLHVKADQLIDDITDNSLNIGDKVLIKNQHDARTNGIYYLLHEGYLPINGTDISYDMFPSNITEISYDNIETHLFPRTNSYNVEQDVPTDFGVFPDYNYDTIAQAATWIKYTPPDSRYVYIIVLSQNKKGWSHQRNVREIFLYPQTFIINNKIYVARQELQWKDEFKYIPYMSWWQAYSLTNNKSMMKSAAWPDKSYPISDISVNFYYHTGQSPSAEENWYGKYHKYTTWGGPSLTAAPQMTSIPAYLANVESHDTPLWEVYDYTPEISNVLVLKNNYQKDLSYIPHVFVGEGATNKNKVFNTYPYQVTVLKTSANFTELKHIVHGTPNSITSDMLQDAIPGSILADSSIEGSKLADDSILGSKLNINIHDSTMPTNEQYILFSNHGGDILEYDPSNIYLSTPGNITLDASNSTQKIELDTSNNIMTLEASGGDISLNANNIYVGGIMSTQQLITQQHNTQNLSAGYIDVSVNLTTNSLTVSSDIITLDNIPYNLSDLSSTVYGISNEFNRFLIGVNFASNIVTTSLSANDISVNNLGSNSDNITLTVNLDGTNKTITASQFIGDVSANDISTVNLSVINNITASQFIGDVSAIDISVNNMTVNTRLTLNSENIAIGSDAGKYNLGTNSIAIGKSAGKGTYGVEQSGNVIILNATGSALNSEGEKRFYVAPVRDAPLETGNLLYYTPSSEVVQSNITFNNEEVSVNGNINATKFVGDVSAIDISVNNLNIRSDTINVLGESYNLTMLFSSLTFLLNSNRLMAFAGNNMIDNKILTNPILIRGDMFDDTILSLDNLSKIIIPDVITEIGNNVMNNNDGDTPFTVICGKNLTTIGSHFLNSSFMVEHLKLPNNVTIDNTGTVEFGTNWVPPDNGGILTLIIKEISNSADINKLRDLLSSNGWSVIYTTE